MIDQLSGHREAIARVCRTFGVHSLDVFGSAARGVDFDPTRSDIDLLVEFGSDGAPTLKLFFELRAELARVVGRPVDLVSRRAIRNPFVVESIERSREPLYVA